mmetsp:Transcript_1345/g.2314  ORF Transcript_1345/g.2314 Transcript_1345/m.2314 type:complete len:128 (-) Transcript_1345:45-428(-)
MNALSTTTLIPAHSVAGHTMVPNTPPNTGRTKKGIASTLGRAGGAGAVNSKSTATTSQILSVQDSRTIASASSVNITLLPKMPRVDAGRTARRIGSRSLRAECSSFEQQRSRSRGSGKNCRCQVRHN